jgi:hypothetical protein
MGTEEQIIGTAIKTGLLLRVLQAREPLNCPPRT